MSGTLGQHTANDSGEHVHFGDPEEFREGSALCWRRGSSGEPIWAEVQLLMVSSGANPKILGILLLNDNLGWREDENPCWKVVHFCLLSQWITFGPVRLKIWNSLLVGNSARKSPREFRLMINLLPVAKRLVNADGQKVSRYHFHLYLGHFLYLPLFHWVTVSTSLQSERRSVCSYQQVSSVAAEWRSWAHVTACVRAAELQILKAVEMLPALRGLEICCGWWKPDWRNGQKRFGWF